MVGDFDEQSDDYTPLEDGSSDNGEQDEDKKKKKEKRKQQRRPKRKRAQEKKSKGEEKQAGQAGQQPSPDKNLAPQQMGVKPAEEKLPKKAPTTLGQAITQPIKDAAQAKLAALENKSPAVKKAAEAVRGTRRAIKTAKEFPKKLMKKAVSKATAPIRKAATKAGQKAVEAIGKKAAGRAVIEAVRATGRAARVISRVLNAMKISNILAQISAKVIKPLVDLAIKALAAISGPAWIVIGILAVVCLFFYYMYTGGLNKINSLAGGSIFVAADYNRIEDRNLVVDLQQKSAGLVPGHVLKLYSASELSADSIPPLVDLTSYDINWRWDAEIQSWAHPLDIRILKTLKYLTDKHEYVEIGLLKTNAPTLLRESLRVKRARQALAEEAGQEYKTITKESYSAFYLGQGMAITAVDYSKIEDLPPKTPIEINWQETVLEKVTRPIWEELAFSVGYLDSNIPYFQQTSSLEIGDLNMSFIVEDYKNSLTNPIYPSIYKKSFDKLDRILELLERIDTFVASKGHNALDDRAKDYFNAAKNRFDRLQFNIGYLNGGSVEGMIRRMGSTENLKLLRDGIQYVYKATQVANMVDWNEKGRANLKWNQAYEARNKIRQMIKELLEMPREVLEPAVPGKVASNFNLDLVAKQIITYSPEDDLDNGRMNIDVFPKGITAVDVGGVAIEGTSTKTTTDADGNVISVTIGDGVVDLADAHFSYMPIDNGSFSKYGTNYIWVFNPEKEDWYTISNLAQMTLRLLKLTTTPGVLWTAAKAQHDYWTGGGCMFVGGMLYNPIFETCQPVTYKGFLQVSF